MAKTIYALVDFFVRNSISDNFYLKLDAMRIFGSVEPQTESTFPFLYIIIFQKWESFEYPSST